MKVASAAMVAYVLVDMMVSDNMWDAGVYLYPDFTLETGWLGMYNRSIKGDSLGNTPLPQMY